MGLPLGTLLLIFAAVLSVESTGRYFSNSVSLAIAMSPYLRAFFLGMHEVGSAPDSGRLQEQDLLPMLSILPKCSPTLFVVDYLDGKDAEDYEMCKMHATSYSIAVSIDHGLIILIFHIIVKLVGLNTDHRPMWFTAQRTTAVLDTLEWDEIANVSMNV